MIEYTVNVDEVRTEWRLDGRLHREDGPAVEYVNKTKHWFLNGKRHREDGPAIEIADGLNKWYLNGERLSETEFNKRTKTKELTVNEIEKLLGYKIKIIGQ